MTNEMYVMSVRQPKMERRASFRTTVQSKYDKRKTKVLCFGIMTLIQNLTLGATTAHSKCAGV